VYPTRHVVTVDDAIAIVTVDIAIVTVDVAIS
jgi:hypothetical protein